MYRVAIVVPVFNVKEYVIECLDSIKNQTHDNFKVFIVNDGSTDSSEILVRSFIKNDDRFVLINQPNSGIGEARNTALEYVENEKFDFVAFVDSDDRVEKTYLQELISAADDNNSDISCCAYYSFSKGFSVIKKNSEFEKMLLNKDEFVDLVLSYGKWSKITGRGGMVWKNLYRAELIKGFRFPSERGIVEDELFNISLVPHIYQVTYISKPLYGYRRRAFSLVRESNFLLKLFNGREKIPPMLKNVSTHAYRVAVIQFVSLAKNLLLRNMYCDLSRVLIYKTIIKDCINQGLVCKSDRNIYNLLVFSPFLFKVILKKKYIWSCIRFWRKKTVYLDN